MKFLRLFTIITILIVSIFLSGCSTANPTPQITEVTPTELTEATTKPILPTTAPTSTTEPITDYFPDKVTIEYATGFSVEYFDNYKVVTVTKPWDFSEETFTYILVQRGTEPPTQFGNAPIIEIPLQSIVPLSTTFLPFLDKFGKLDTVVALNNATYISNRNVLELVENGVPSVGEGPAIDVETLINLEPEVIMTTAYGFPEYDTHPVLLQAGLTTVINGDYMENTPLGRAEWGKFIAVFYNEEKAATEFFNQTVAKYNEIKGLAENIEVKPTVFLNTAWEGTWYVPGGQSYMANFINDAGGTYLWENDPNTGSLYLSFEEVYDNAGENGDIWLNPGGSTYHANDLVQLDERYSQFTAFKNGAMFNNVKIISEMGGNDFFESGTAYPDLILADLFAIFHPDQMADFDPNFEFTYYIQVAPAE